MKATIVYHSVSGNTKKMAELIATSMNTVEGVDARAFSIDQIDEDFATESRCIIVGSPIYAASNTAAIHTWLQSSLKSFKPFGKLGGAFATANYVHGGGELGIRSILDAMITTGMLVYSGGAAFGQPVIHLGPVALGNRMEETESYFEEYGKRMAQKAVELFGK